MKKTISSEEQKSKMRRALQILKKLAAVVLNPHFLLCFGFAWIITNGWAYILLGIGVWTKSGWISAVASGYLTFLWFPMTPEKIITLTISIFLLKKLFPKDEKTLGVLHEWYEKAKVDLKNAQVKRKNKKRKRKNGNNKSNTGTE